MVAKRRDLKIPNAPLGVGFWATRKLVRAGKRDAKKYKDLRDTTPTHLIKRLESSAQIEQRKVNEWLVLQLNPLRTGNAALEALVAQLEEQIKVYELDLGPTGRIRKANSKRLDGLRQQRLNAISQRESNFATGLGLIEIAAEALDTWRRFFESQAAIYIRARALKLKQNPPAGAAQLPVFDTVDLIDVRDFQEPRLQTQEGTE